MSETLHARLLIIGAGPAGYTAAIYGARAMLQPTLVQGLQPGGQLTITTDVENYPGFADTVQGPWLMEQMAAQAERMGAHLLTDTIIEADLSRRPFRCRGDSGLLYTGDALVIATGAQAKWLGLRSESRLRGAGVSACATCDGFFYRGKEVVVVGGGNTAVEEAIFLTHFATKVTLVHRRGELRAERIMQERLFANPKIAVIWNAGVEEILAEGDPPVVSGVRLRDLASGELRQIPAEGVFIAIGHAPATELFRGQIEMDRAGYIKTVPAGTATSLPGVFAAGDVADATYRQAVTAAGLGCMAALDAERWLTAEAAPRLRAVNA
jgi:thioredoxin reductase (NADPH)